MASVGPCQLSSKQSELKWILDPSVASLNYILGNLVNLSLLPFLTGDIGTMSHGRCLDCISAYLSAHLRGSICSSVHIGSMLLCCLCLLHFLETAAYHSTKSYFLFNGCIAFRNIYI